jgi:hypothetical protein
MKCVKFWYLLSVKLILFDFDTHYTCKTKWSQCNHKHCHKHILQIKCANGNMPAENECCNQSGFEVAVSEN